MCIRDSYGTVQARVDQLSEGARFTLKVASVIGPVFPYRLLAAIYPVPVREEELRSSLKTLEDLELILPKEPGPDPIYAFRHAITREVVYESMAPSQRRRLHEAVARWYEGHYGDNLEPYFSLLAYHYGRAGRPERELQYLLLAADRAHRIHALAEAVAYYRRALDLLDPAQEPAHTADVLKRLARGAHYLGRYEEAIGCLQEALSLYEQVGDELGAAEVCFEIAGRLSVQDLEEAFRYVRRGMEALRDHPDAQHLLIEGYARWAQLERNRGNYEAAKEALDQALSLAERANDLHGLWWSYRVLSLYHYSRGERREAFEAGRLTLHYLEELEGPAEQRVIAMNNLACFAQDLGEIEAALETAQKGLALAQRAGIVSERVVLATTLAGIYNHLGRWEEAERVLEEGWKLLAESPHPYHEVALNREAGKAAYGQKEWDRAIDHWGRAEEGSRRGSQQIFNAEMCACLAMAWVQKGDLDQAQRWAARARRLAQRRHQWGTVALAWRAQGMLERERGDWQAGAEALQEALRTARRLNDPVETAYTLLEYGLLRLREGRVEEGIDLARKALERATAIHLQPVVRDARAALQAYGASLSPPRHGGGGK